MTLPIDSNEPTSDTPAQAGDTDPAAASTPPAEPIPAASLPFAAAANGDAPSAPKGNGQVGKRDVFYDDELSGKAYDARLMIRLLRYLRPHTGLLGLTIALTVTLAVVEVAWPWLLGWFIDGPFRAYVENPAAEATSTTFFWFLVTFVAYLIVNFFVRWAYAYYTGELGQRTIYDLRVELFEHLQRLDLQYFERNPVGRLVTRVTSDIEALAELFSSGVVALVADLLRILVIFIVMFFINWQLALILLAITPVVVLTTWIFGNRMRRAFRETRKRLAAVNAYLQESISGLAIIQSFRQETKASTALDRRNRTHYEAQLETIFNFALFAPLVEFFANIAVAALLYVGGLKLIAAVDPALAADPMATGFTLGVFTMFYFWARKLFEPIRELSEKYNILQSAMAASERVFRILDTAPVIRYAEPAEPKGTGATIQGDIRFENVWFAYTGDDWVLRDVSFHAKPGQRIALVGATGSGKTTITNLVPRFYDVQRGRVLIDGVDARDYRPQDLRRAISIVLQDVFLFTGSIERNIRLDGDIPPEKVRAVAKELGAHDFIDRLPNKYDQDVHERGLTLSTGQRQLVAFARALVFDPRILILDEATANIDTESEMLVQRGLDKICEGRTSIIVAHRLSTIRKADQILVIHKGEIRERGRHEELMAHNGLYARLYALQYAAATAD